VPLIAGRLQPLAAAYDVAAALPALEAAFARGERRLTAAVRELRIREFSVDETIALALRQANTPAELGALRAAAAGRPGSGSAGRG
jgi:molybdopterin-guanine dinucleotide biosynthesis protein A